MRPGSYGCGMTAKRSWVEQIMGLPISVLARGDVAQSSRADAAVREVFAELIEVDRVFSPYKHDSVVSHREGERSPCRLHRHRADSQSLMSR